MRLDVVINNELISSLSLSLSLSRLLLFRRYFFGMNVEWSASVKEVSQNDFWTEVCTHESLFFSNILLA